MNGKYIIITTEFGEMPITFPKTVKHNSLIACNKIISAGFFEYKNNKFVCYGRSDSLDIDSRPEKDAELMNMFFNLPI